MGVRSSPLDCGVGRDVGEQRHVVPTPDELLGQEGNDPFRSTVQRGWHWFHERSQDGDPHCTVLLRDPSISVGQVSRRGLEPRILPNALCCWQKSGLTGGSNDSLHDSCPRVVPSSALPVFPCPQPVDRLVAWVV